MRLTGMGGIILAGAAAGTVNGVFGAGGGMVLIPLLMAFTDLQEQKIFPCCVFMILPMCVISLLTTAVCTDLPWATAAPYLIGGALGGLAAGAWGRRRPLQWMHRGLGILITWAGLRYLWNR